MISDFYDCNDESTKHFYHLAKHNEVTCIKVFDELERQLPPAGQYAISDGLNRSLLNTSERRLRERYQKQSEQQQQKLQENLAKARVPLITLQTGCDPMAELLQFYALSRSS